MLHIVNEMQRLQTPVSKKPVRKNNGIFQGENNPHAKLTCGQVVFARGFRQKTVTARDVAAVLNVSASCITHIWNCDNWRHLINVS